MSNAVILGTQYGDEGKGRLVDALSTNFDCVARFQGGANAGHTVRIKDQEYVLHLLPSGIIRGKLSIQGMGMVEHPPTLVEEINGLTARGIRITPDNLVIDPRIHVTTRYHIEEDKKNGGTIGTTGRGVGQTYDDKYARRGFTFGDLLNNPEIVRERINSNMQTVYRDPGRKLDPDEVFGELEESVSKLAPFVRGTIPIARSQDSILFEGAQSHWLGINTGNYPFVTASDTTIAGVFSSFGLIEVPRRIGVVKAYTTRVGNGPFETELEAGLAEKLRKRGKEYGATTGRPRRCGWLDLELVDEAIRFNDITELALTKLDVLSGFERIGIRARNGHLCYLDSWDDPNGIKAYEDLPETAKRYIQFIEGQLGVPITMISIGAERSELVLKE